LSWMSCILFFSLLTTHDTNMYSPAGLKPTTQASNRPQTITLDRSATGIGSVKQWTVQSIASHYTNCATLAPDIMLGKRNRLSVPRYIRLKVTRYMCIKIQMIKHSYTSDNQILYYIFLHYLALKMEVPCSCHTPVTNHQ
jgi:hypothetical protein